MTAIEQFLEQKNIRPTAMRILVYQFLDTKEIAVGLTAIEHAFDKAERTTLYRTLKTFEEKGVVHQIDDGTGTTKYALCEAGCNCDVEQDLHLHFHCTKCNETTCLTDHKIQPMNLPDNFTAEDVNLVVKGICDKCND
ncbi:transcriptional repressor [Cellulophaga baltica]|uniref:Fur family transcriptional regulator n=1 Tax=Cellulophaga TaxID=104264 RepID=UPI001C07988C|nr:MULTISPECIES: transcriptional repressor [Cellulophaga]MBU2996699.1 transcriptional repressor [Cellulophaga baltica]MDO6768093.1 transcriptional repressor [Cellulophaga sp. 1_MG-2023]